ncbi:hypothetical protein GOP47_0030039 [Adiantum capillus-veneris]|nr:hypothetical protein GOP47_0030039 [Adiantum capillus-veneris]
MSRHLLFMDTGDLPNCWLEVGDWTSAVLYIGNMLTQHTYILLRLSLTLLAEVGLATSFTDSKSREGQVQVGCCTSKCCVMDFRGIDLLDAGQGAYEGTIFQKLEVPLGAP